MTGIYQDYDIIPMVWCHNHFYEHFIVNQDLILHYLFLDTPNHPGTGK